MVLPENECPAHYNEYLKLVGEDVLLQLEEQLNSFSQQMDMVPEEKELYRYAEGKWTIKQILGHITDTERMMLHRAFTIARNDKTPLPPFDQDDYVAAADFNSKKMKTLINDFVIQRRATISLFKSLNQEQLQYIGTASGHPVSARALFYFLLGHLEHHQIILKERYLSN